MSKNAYYSDYLWFNGAPLEKQWLLTENQKITGHSPVQPDRGVYHLHIFDNSAIFPTLINTHTHLPMALLRGYADDLPLQVWLREHIWPAEKKWLSEEFIEDGTMLAAAELIRCGVSCVNEMYFYPEVESAVFERVGLRGLFGCGVMNFQDAFKNVEQLIEKYKDNPMINISFCPHAPFTVPPEIYKKIVDYSAKTGTVIHTHLAETEWEVNEIIKRYEMRPAELMDSVGVFDCPSVFAHCVHLSDEEIILMGKKKANVSHCLQSNLKLASGFAPMSRLMENGANITIGTDGAASNNDQNMLSEINSVALFHKGLTGDPTVFDAAATLKCATENAALALGFNETGILKEGYQADFMVVSYDAPHMQPVFNPLSHLIYSAQKSDITDVYVADKALMQSGKLTTIDEEAVMEKAAAWKTRISGNNC